MGSKTSCLFVSCIHMAAHLTSFDSGQQVNKQYFKKYSGSIKIKNKRECQILNSGSTSSDSRYFCLLTQPGFKWLLESWGQSHLRGLILGGLKMSILNMLFSSFIHCTFKLCPFSGVWLQCHLLQKPTHSFIILNQGTLMFLFSCINNNSIIYLMACFTFGLDLYWHKKEEAWNGKHLNIGCSIFRGIVCQRLL